VDYSFNDKVGVVTGGASGIGLAVAAGLLTRGAKVTIVDRNPEALEAASERLQAYTSEGRLVSIAADVSKKEDVDRYVFETVEAFGRIDLFHNNAGVGDRLVPLLENTVEDYLHLFGVNVFGMFTGMQAVARIMLDQGGGAIVNTGSVTATRTMPNCGLYGASKAAVQRLTQHAASEWGSGGVRVNAISPGSVDTPLLRRSQTTPGVSEADVNKRLKAMARGRPLGRLITAEEAANLVLWLLSPNAAMITGSIYIIDGGITA
jgi:NAD(P)-dependent dehydrogenase (short-subunit alcohol dehydrogenase family)